MPLRAGFAEIDITPPVGTLKVGWLIQIVSEVVLDPLYARAAVLESNGTILGWLQFDTLSVRWTQVNAIRRQIEARYGVPGGNIMVAATHNHAGPAVANVGDVPRDDAYLHTLTEKAVAVFGNALERLEAAEIGFGSGFEFEVGYNRRVIMRDGTTRTHGTFAMPDALCLEGPIDPEIAVLAARNRQGNLLGALVNFACHPAHHGPDGALSAGFPGVLATEMKARGCPVTLFLNGAAGDISTSNPCANGVDKPMEAVGARLAEDAERLLHTMTFRRDAAFACCAETIQLPYRHVTEAECAGTVRGAQRFVDPAAYDRGMPRLRERIRERNTQPAEVQVQFLDDLAFVAIPAEFFVELGLQIKEAARPRRALVVGYANGMVGYVPHSEAFARGGYETTFAGSSRLAPEAGILLVDCALKLLRQQ